MSFISTMPSDFFYREKIPVAILGATGCVGQRFIQALLQHPWFQIVALCASEKSVGKKYGEVVHWLLADPLPDSIAQMPILPCQSPLSTIDCSIVFSALESQVAENIEMQFAEAGYVVISNASTYRMHPHVPLVIGEVNSSHLTLLDRQSFKGGKIITNPNCSAVGLTLALKPLADAFGIESVQIVTLQALSGAGYPGVASLDIQDNIIPYIAGEEEKIESEPLKILGCLANGEIEPANIKISAQCTRVAVSDGHFACVSVQLQTKAKISALIDAWQNFKGEPQEFQLPSAPVSPIYYFSQPDYPQPRLHRKLDKEMAVSIGYLRSCRVLDFKFHLLSHNTIRGAVGSALLNAELLVKKGYIYW